MITLESKRAYYKCHILHSEFTLVTLVSHRWCVWHTVYTYIHGPFLYKILHSNGFQDSILWNVMSDFKGNFYMV